MPESSQPLPTLRGPIHPIGPTLERELALIFEEYEDAGELAAAVVAFAFTRRLVFRSELAPDLVHFPITREGEARTCRVIDPPPPEPRRSKGTPEWTAAMPVRRRA